MKKANFKLRLLTKGVISVAFFWVLFSFVQTDELFKIFQNIDYIYFFLSFALVPVMVIVSCLKWKIILNLHSRKVPFFRLIRIYLIGYLFSNLLPSTVGGDVVRSYYSGKLINNQSFAAIAIFIERFSGLFLLFFLVLFTPMLQNDLYARSYFFIPSVGAFFLIGVIIWIWRVQNPLDLPARIARMFFSLCYKISSFSRLSMLSLLIERAESFCCKIHARLEKLHFELRLAVTTIQKDRSLFWRIIFITILFYFLTLLNVYVSFMAFGVSVDFLKICAIVPTALFVAQIPVTLLGNLGFFESVFVGYFLFIGIPGAETLAMGLLLRLKMMSMGGAGYLSYISYSGVKYGTEEFEKLQKP